jgi:uncharacterized membrane protein YdjX (TVP38/TMEM64 family)
MRRLGAAGPVAIVLSFWPPLGGFVLLAFLTALGPWLRDHGTVGMLTYVVVAGILMGVSFVPTYSCAIIAGWAFGFAAGLPLALIAITGSALIAYVIGRWIARDRVLEVIQERPRWNAIHRALLRGDNVETITVVTLMRIPPAAPFALANFVLAAARVPSLAYTVGSFLGVIPRTAMATFAAAKLEQLRFKDVSERWMVVAGIVATVIVCIVLGVMANRALRQITDRKV